MISSAFEILYEDDKKLYGAPDSNSVTASRDLDDWLNTLYSRSAQVTASRWCSNRKLNTADNFVEMRTRMVLWIERWKEVSQTPQLSAIKYTSADMKAKARRWKWSHCNVEHLKLEHMSLSMLGACSEITCHDHIRVAIIAGDSIATRRVARSRFSRDHVRLVWKFRTSFPATIPSSSLLRTRLLWNVGYRASHCGPSEQVSGPLQKSTLDSDLVVKCARETAATQCVTGVYAPKCGGSCLIICLPIECHVLFNVGPPVAFSCHRCPWMFLWGIGFIHVYVQPLQLLFLTTD